MMAPDQVLIYGDERIPYKVNTDPSRSSRIAIHVSPDGGVIVDAPPGQTDEAIVKAVQKRARWVVDHVTDARTRFQTVRKREYVSGEEILYLGKRYVLKVIQADELSDTVRLKGNRLEVRSSRVARAKIKVMVRLWYHDRATRYFGKRMKEIASSLPWLGGVPSFKLAAMKRQWGNCSPAGDIVLNPHLVKARRDCIDYVLTHELLHLKHHDHGAEFYRALDRWSPGWQRSKSDLDKLVEILTLE